MNVVYVCHGGLTSQSTYHVLSIAEQLRLGGHHCLVCIPEHSAEDANAIRTTVTPIVDFAQALRNELSFSDEKGPTLIHCWTPREQVRKFTERLAEIHGCPYFVHLEDNEREILNRALEGIRYEDLVDLPAEEQEARIRYPELRIHPQRHWEFLKGAVGCTVLADKLKEHVPTGTPVQLFWPGADTCFLRDSDQSRVELRSRFDIPLDRFVVLYAGAFHAINHDDISSMVTALKILINRGMPLCLVKTGHNDYPELLRRGIADGWIRDLGFLPREQLPDLYTLADVMIQPGQCDVFNEYRFPSKLPEALARRLPVILPHCNLGLVLKDDEEAVINHSSSMEALMTRVGYLYENPDVRVRIGENGRRFCLEHLTWDKAARTIAAFYASCISATRAELGSRGLLQMQITDFRTVASSPAGSTQSGPWCDPITPGDLYFLYQEEQQLAGKGTTLASTNTLQQMDILRRLASSQRKRQRYKFLFLTELVIIVTLLIALNR